VIIMAVKYFQTFRPSNEYETAAAEAQRRQALAEALQQQAFQPIQVNPAGPISYTQGLAKILESYAAGREEKKAKEAERKAASEIEKDVAGVERTGQQLRESIESGRKPLTAAETTPDASGLAMVRGPLDPVRLASSKYGREALVTDPELLEAYKMARTKPTGKIGEVSPDKFTPESLAQYQTTGNPAVLVPVAKESRAPATVGGMMWNEKTGKFEPIAGYAEQQAAGRAPEPLVPILGSDGKAKYVTRSQAVGQTPYTGTTLKQELQDAERQRAQKGTEISTQKALDDAAALYMHPGREAGTGFSSWMGNIPGTQAKDFTARLNTFKAETFVPMVSALKGMGALSDAEGKKLSESVGALDPSMTEDEFAKSLYETTKFLFDKAKAAGLNVSMPTFPGMSGENTQSGWGKPQRVK
jgi:hypothetical protein